MASIMYFTEDTPKEQYEELYKLDICSIFKVRFSDFETVMQRIEDYMPENLLFKVYSINPGTDLFMLYGPEHCIITDNREIL